MHKELEAERNKPLTDKERDALKAILIYVVASGEKCDASTLFLRFNPSLTPAEAMVLVEKIWKP